MPIGLWFEPWILTTQFSGFSLQQKQQDPLSLPRRRESNIALRRDVHGEAVLWMPAFAGMTLFS
jgi:hypothetical protein